MELHSFHLGKTNRSPTWIESCLSVLKLSECFRKQPQNYGWWEQKKRKLLMRHKQWLENKF